MFKNADDFNILRDILYQNYKIFIAGYKYYSS